MLDFSISSVNMAILVSNLFIIFLVLIFRLNYCRSPTMYIFLIYWPLSWEKHAVYAFFMIRYPGGIFLRLYGAVASYIRCSSTSNVIMTVKSI